MEQSPMRKPLTVLEAASYLHVHRDTMRRYIRERKVPAAKVGRSYLIRPEDLDAFIANNLTTNEQP